MAAFDELLQWPEPQEVEPHGMRGEIPPTELSLSEPEGWPEGRDAQEPDNGEQNRVDR